MKKDKDFYIDAINSYCFNGYSEDLTEEQKQEIFDTVIFEAPYSVKCFDDAVMAFSEQKFDRIVEELATEFAEC